MEIVGGGEEGKRKREREGKSVSRWVGKRRQKKSGGERGEKRKSERGGEERDSGRERKEKGGVGVGEIDGRRET